MPCWWEQKSSSLPLELVFDLDLCIVRTPGTILGSIQSALQCSTFDQQRRCNVESPQSSFPQCFRLLAELFWWRHVGMRRLWVLQFAVDLHCWLPTRLGYSTGLDRTSSRRCMELRPRPLLRANCWTWGKVGNSNLVSTNLSHWI